MVALTWQSMLLIGLGGALGAMSRAGVSHWISGGFPWATLLVNVAGSLALGWVMQMQWSHHELQQTMRSFLAIGFCGAFTTFSTFSYQTFNLLQQGRLLSAVGNILMTVTLTLVAVFIGMRLARLFTE